MAKNNLINVFCFNREIGRIGMDIEAKKCYFQYHPEFIQSGDMKHLFPLIFKRIPQTQVFTQFNNNTFRGLPPMIADSLPDAFGNTIYNTWMTSKNSSIYKISSLEQLAYVANRGLGALEYHPIQSLPKNTEIHIDEIVEILKLVLAQKNATKALHLSTKSLLNIFKIGSSAGGARPKILISENTSTGKIHSGDIITSQEYNHYLVKLNLDDDKKHPKELIEYLYYQTAIECGIHMMPSKLIEDKHFATLRFDRQKGKKIHTLTASGISGWDFQNPDVSSYENLFELALFLKLSFKDMQELFRRMVFNVVFCNHDDHLKNHSFMYDEMTDRWKLAPAYDLTYSLNPELQYSKVARALSINGKRHAITIGDILKIADQFTIKQPKKIIEEVQSAIAMWHNFGRDLNIPKKLMQQMDKGFLRLL